MCASPPADERLAQAPAATGQPLDWRRSQYGMALVVFISFFGFNSVQPILPLYVAELGAAPDRIASLAGLIISLAATATPVAATVAGRLATRVPARRVLLFALVAGATLCFPLALARTPGELLVGRALLGLFAGGTLTLAYTVGDQAIPAARKGAALGLLSSASLLGSASSPLATGAQAIEAMLAGEPSVAIMGFGDPQIVRVDVRVLSDGEAEQVATRLRQVLGG